MTAIEQQKAAREFAERWEGKAIEEKVDAEAERRTIEEIGTMGFGSCHTFWKHKKKILREEYHMIWRSPQDLNPEFCFD